MSNNPSARSFCFTMNNPNYPLDQAQARFDEQNHIKSLSMSLETGESGTPHEQGVGRSVNTMRPTAFANKLKYIFGQSCHVEKMQGTYPQAYEYTRKEGGREVQMGPQPNPAAKQKNGMDGVRDTILSMPDASIGELHTALYDNHFGTFVRNERGIQNYIQHQRRSYATRSLEVEWRYGPTGSGKTFGAPIGPDAYWKPPESRWFPGYTGQKTLVLDEFRKNWFTFSYMLRLLDVYPLQLEIKGGYVQLEATKIIITSPFHPRDLYPTREDVGQLIRRCTRIIKCTKVGDDYVAEEVGDIMPQQQLDFFSGDNNDLEDLIDHEFGTSYDFGN